jgi:hypothetical protein
MERHRPRELDIRATLATVTSQRQSAVVAVLALVPLVELHHVHLEHDLLDGAVGAVGTGLAGEPGGDLPDGDGRGVQDGLAAGGFGAVDVVQEVGRVPRRGGVAEDAAGGGVLAGAGEGDLHGALVAGLFAGAGEGVADLAGEGGERLGHLDGWLGGWEVGS